MALQTPETNTIPGPHFPETGRFYLSFRRDPLQAFQQMARTYGDVVHIPIGKQNIYLLSHPDDIREVLVVHHQQMRKPNTLQQTTLLGNGLLRSEDEFHKRQRRLMQPAFHRQRIAAYGRTMIDYTQRTSSGWRDSQQLDILEEMMGLTLTIAGETMFGADVEEDVQTVRKALTTWMRLNNATRFTPFRDLLNQLPLPQKRQRAEARDQLNAIVYRLIEERRASNEDHGDLLSMLLHARDEEGDGSGMTDEQLRDEVMTLFLAGHETTANALSWTFYLLAQHPEVEAKLQEELETVLAGRTPVPEDAPRLKYTEMILSEAMRLYPPAWTIGRLTTNPYRVHQYTIPAKALIVMSQYVVQHDPRWYPDPFRFDPERWTPEARATRPKFAYFPFGGGPRVCIGEAFAWMEGTLVIATLAQKWRLHLVPGHRVETEPLVTLRPKGGIQMRLESRS